jgi:hypothetical protein
MFFDTDLIHGYSQRVRRDQVLAMVPPLVTRAMERVKNLNLAVAAIRRKLRQVAGASLVRIARGFLGRVTAAEMRYLRTINAAAVAIQSVYWGYRVRRYDYPRAIHERRMDRAARIQALWKGYRTRQWFAKIKDLERFREASAAAERIQALWKGYWVRRNREEVLASAAQRKAEWQEKRHNRLVDARTRRQARRELAAVNIQRIVRGFFGRRDAYMRRQQGFISHPKVRALADAYLAGGDLWGLLAAVSKEFEQRDAAHEREERQASAFVHQMVRLREEQEMKDWDEWMSIKNRRRAPESGARKTVDGKRHNKSGGLVGSDPGVMELADDDLKLALLERMYLHADRGPSSAAPGVSSSGKFLGKGGGTGALSRTIASTDSPFKATAGTVKIPPSSRQSRPISESNSAFLSERSRRGRSRQDLGLPPGADPDRVVSQSIMTSATLKSGLSAKRPKKQEQPPSSPIQTLRLDTHSLHAPPPLHTLETPGTTNIPLPSAVESVNVGPSMWVESPTKPPTGLESRSIVVAGQPESRSESRSALQGLQARGAEVLQREVSVAELQEQRADALRSETDARMVRANESLALVPHQPSSTASLGSSGGELGPLRVTAGVQSSVAAAVSLEETLASHSVGRPSARTLLRDVRGLDGPCDALVLHATLRVIPIPQGVLEWCEQNGMAVPPEVAELSRQAAVSGGFVGPTEDAEFLNHPELRGVSSRVPSDFRRIGHGEIAARLFSDLPPSVMKVRWESTARDVAAPVVAELRRQGCTCVRDVYSSDLDSAKINPIIVGSIFRLIRILEMTQKMTDPSTVRTMFASLPRPVPPPLFGPGRAGVGGVGHEESVGGASMPFGESAIVAERRLERSVKRSAESKEPVMDDEDEPEGSGFGLTGVVAQSSTSTLPYWSLASRGQPGSGLAALKSTPQSFDQYKRTLRKDPHSVPKPQARLFVTKSDAVGRPFSVPVETNTLTPAPTQVVDLSKDGPLVYHEPGLFGEYGSVAQHYQADAETRMSVEEAKKMGASVTMPVTVVPEVPVAHTVRRMKVHGRRGFRAGDPRAADSVGEDEVLVPDGMEVLERDDSLTALGIRRTARELTEKERRRVEAAKRSNRARKIAEDATRQALAKLRGTKVRAMDEDEAEGTGDAAHLELSASERRDLVERSSLNSASALVGVSLVDGADVPHESETAASLRAQRDGSFDVERTMSSMLARLHLSVNTLRAVQDLEAPVDAAVIQVCVRLPIPMPNMVQLVDYRSGRSRNEVQRSRVLVPYDLFLRQLVAYEAAAAAGVGARGGGFGSKWTSGDEVDDLAARVREAEEAALQKQRMLVKERLSIATVMARPWIRGLTKAGFTRVGQLIKMPRLELERSVAVAYPIKPDAGVVLAGRRAQELAANVPPSRVAQAIEAALEHWLQICPDIADMVYQRVSSFDPRYQKGPTDTRRSAASRAFVKTAESRQPLGSADWRTFERQRYGTKPLSRWVSDAPPSSPVVVDAQRSETAPTPTRVKPLLAPLAFDQERVRRDASLSRQAASQSRAFHQRVSDADAASLGVDLVHSMPSLVTLDDPHSVPSLRTRHSDDPPPVVLSSSMPRPTI